MVFEGCNVKDQDNRWAIFQEITSCPATMEAGKMADAYGVMTGHTIEMADGESAYTQAELGGPLTWVRIPRERWPDSWEGTEDPVCPLRLALYGHPDAGGFWEKHCEKAVTAVGFDFLPDWPSVFFHKELRLMLVIYVDDFKLAGPKTSMEQGWKLLGEHIKLEEARPTHREIPRVSSHSISGESEGPIRPETRMDEGRKQQEGTAKVPRVGEGSGREGATDHEVRHVGLYAAVCHQIPGTLRRSVSQGAGESEDAVSG